MKFAVSVFVMFLFCFVEAALGQEFSVLRAGINGDSARPRQDTSSGAQKGDKKPLTNEDVVRMVKAGLAESTIFLAIEQNPTDFDTTPDALISLRGQGVSEKVLDAMLAAGGDHQHSLPAAGGRTSADSGSPEKSGEWAFHEEISAEDGSNAITLILPAEQEGSASTARNNFAHLYIRCKSRQTDVYTDATLLPADADVNGNYKVGIRLDDGPLFSQSWQQSTQHNLLFAPNAVAFARILAASKRLSVEFVPSGSGRVVSRFDLNGLPGVLGKVADACGWTVQSGARKDAAENERPPDLHAIRKVFLNSDWADDEIVLARKSAAIGKHTCLQVVDTLAAADAVLRWSIEGFGGGALELRSKEGQVIWSKSGSLSAPLGALNQAVGCRKQ
jgi:hypothetical protein